MARKISAMRAEEKLGGFATAKKHITVQYNERERSVDNLLSLIRRDAIENHGITDDDITEVNVYIKPEENAVYYVEIVGLKGLKCKKELKSIKKYLNEL